jgi:hypothetical protein
MLLYKIQTFLILDSFDDLPVVGWWNVLLVVQNEFQMVKNKFLNFLLKLGHQKGDWRQSFEICQNAMSMNLL